MLPNWIANLELLPCSGMPVKFLLLRTFKVFIVDDCQHMDKEGWYSVFSSLEGIPDSSIFVMITSDIDKLPSNSVGWYQIYMFCKIDDVVDGLVGAIDRGTETLASLAEVIKEVAAAKTTLNGLFEEVDNLPGFELEHKSNDQSLSEMRCDPKIPKEGTAQPFTVAKLARIIRMVCMSVEGCLHVHRSALDYFLAVLVVVAVVAARLFICAVARCLVRSVAGGAAHHHHHHPTSSPATTDEDVEMWGAGTGPPAIYRHSQHAGHHDAAEPPSLGGAAEIRSSTNLLNRPKDYTDAILSPSSARKRLQERKFCLVDFGSVERLDGDDVAELVAHRHRHEQHERRPLALHVHHVLHRVGDGFVEEARCRPARRRPRPPTYKLYPSLAVSSSASPCSESEYSTHRSAPPPGIVTVVSSISGNTLPPICTHSHWSASSSPVTTQSSRRTMSGFPLCST
ncbi:hypothetical protein GUJ93_ZPchr0008g12556 [Zizania palustris]|uniref:Uncharacterized protein n=1 Tax=Zizania palustris TaxID=103762 RepID=A0A8J5V5D8_ZIZPA|nr:hypothetical protein GUJ93_ZPchr0008g12556 [Zizania palustris]